MPFEQEDRRYKDAAEFISFEKWKIKDNVKQTLKCKPERRRDL
jgi:hypothetical protein